MKKKWGKLGTAITSVVLHNLTVRPFIFKQKKENKLNKKPHMF